MSILPLRKAYHNFLKNIFLPVGDIISGRNFISRLKYLEKMQWESFEVLAQQRDQSLQKTIKTVYAEVPFYKQLFDTANIDPQSIKTLQDLQRIPIVTKNNLRSQSKAAITRATPKQYSVFTSGSTGAPFEVLKDYALDSWYRASFYLALQWAGYHLGDPHLQLGMTLKRNQGRWIKDLMMLCYYVSAYDLSDAQLQKNLETIEKNKAEYIFGYPGSVYHVAKYALSQGWNTPLLGAITWGDNLYEYQRKTIEKAFQTKVYDTYGVGEGMQVAAQCEHGKYHIHMLDVAVDFVDDDGQLAEPGQVANLILTRLTPGPMPFIRYKVGDVGVAAKADETCECGRAFPLIHDISGRDTDIITTPDGNRLIVHFFTGILEFYTDVETFQVVQTAPDELIIRLLPANDFDADTTPQRIVQELKDHGAGTMKITTEVVDEIPLTKGGKRRFIISLVDKETTANQ